MNRQIPLALLLAAALGGVVQAQIDEKPAMKTTTRPAGAESAATRTLQTATFALG